MKNLLIIFGLVFFSQNVIAGNEATSKKSEQGDKYTNCSMVKDKAVSTKTSKEKSYHKKTDQTLNSVIRTSSY